MVQPSTPLCPPTRKRRGEQRPGGGPTLAAFGGGVGVSESFEMGPSVEFGWAGSEQAWPQGGGGDGASGHAGAWGGGQGRHKLPTLLCQAPAVWQLISGLGPLTRAELARALSVTRRTASQAATALGKADLAILRPGDHALAPKKAHRAS